MKGSAVIAAAAALLVGILVFIFVQFQHGGGKGVRVGLNKAEACTEVAPRCIPKMTFIDTTGMAFPPDTLAGKVVIVNFWATWCRPCAVEIPDLVDVYRRYKDKDVVMLGLLADDVNDQELELFIKQYGVNYPVVLVDDDIAKAFDYPEALPTTFIYDRRGHMEYGRPGLVSAGQLESTVDRLLK